MSTAAKDLPIFKTVTPPEPNLLLRQDDRRIFVCSRPKEKFDRDSDLRRLAKIIIQRFLIDISGFFSNVMVVKNEMAEKIPRLSFDERFIDSSIYELDEELKKVDDLLSNPELLKSFELFLDESLGPSMPPGVCLRMMYLKFRWGLNYDEIQHEVQERLRWRHFCRLSLNDRVPSSTTLITFVQKFDEKRITDLNKYLVQSLANTRSIRAVRICIDSGTIDTEINYSKSGAAGETPKTIAGSTNLATEHRVQFWSSWLIIVTFLSCLTWAVAMAGIGWNHTLSDQHGFRQSQTAITSYYLMRGGPLLSYETPVLGRPWNIPFEFPLYQWFVAAASSLFNAPLNQTGRFVSELFFYLSLVFIWYLLSELSVRPVHRLVFLSLVLVSPTYVFWSRTFMIESTALFLCTAYLFYTIRFTRDRSLLALLLGGILGILGMLVKTTTMPSFVIVAGLFYLSAIRNQPKNIRLAFSTHLVPLFFFVGLPALAILIWTHYTDDIKSLNVVGLRLTSWHLTGWTFGPLSLRFSSSTWMTLFSRIIPDLLGANVVLLLPLIGICFARDRLFPFTVCIIAFLSAFLLFTNLHVVHNYYTYANGIFLIAASSWCVVGLLEQKKWKHVLGVVIFSIMALVSVKGYYGWYYTVQKNNAVHLEGIASVIKWTIRPDEIMLIFGQDWSSELPYYSERRALLWPDWMPQDMNSPEMKAALSKLPDTQVVALVVCNGARINFHLIAAAINLLNLPVTPYYEDTICTLYTSPKTL